MTDQFTQPNQQRTYQVSKESLQPNQTVFLKGTTVVNHLHSVLTGQELVEENNRRRQLGMKPYTGQNLTYITVKEAEVLALGNPANEQAETFIRERLYRSKKPENQANGFYWSKDNASNRVPEVQQLVGTNPDGSRSYAPVTLTGELAPNTPVILVLETFVSKNYDVGGIAIRKVLIDQTGEIPYKGADRPVDSSALAALGIVLDSGSSDESGQGQAAPQQQVQQQAPQQQAPQVPQAGQNWGSQPQQAQPQQQMQPQQMQQQVPQVQQAPQQQAPASGDQGQGAFTGNSPFDSPAAQGQAPTAPWDNQAGGIQFTD